MIVARLRATTTSPSRGCNDDGAETCSLSGAGEWDVPYTLGFVADGAGRRLAWVRAREVGSEGTPELDAQFETERHAAARCP